MHLYQKFGKRSVDLVVSSVVLVLALPVLIVLTIALTVSNGGQPFFFQKRPGQNGRIFRLVKFRTMNNKRDSEGNLLPDHQRITTLGLFVRKSSLDELLQLLNVISGEMSLIGPRPLLVEYLPRYNQQQLRRHEVKPGITGWAQVNGRNAISWEQKFQLDVWYVDNISWQLDARIIMLTIKKVFRTEGISQQGHATMPVFKGTNNS